MFRTWCFTNLLILAAALVAAVASPLRAADVPAAADEEAELIAVLQSDAPPQDKAIPCKRLAVVGSAKAVPALAALLPNDELSSWALIALEAIPDPAADAALREAAGKLEGRPLVGVINAIGVRRDAQAVEGLAKLLTDADAEVASAAAVALGRVGDDAAAKALQPLLAAAPAAVRSAVAEGCILCAERFLAEGKAAQASQLYDQVRAAEVPQPRMLEATRGAILARGADGVPLLIEQLRSEDRQQMYIGLAAARELSGDKVTEALVAELAKITSERQPLLLLALADRGDAAVLPAMIEAAQTSRGPVQMAAIGVVGRLGDAKCIPALLDMVASGDAATAQAAKSALQQLPGDDVDADLAARLPAAKGPVRLLLIELVGLRRMSEVPALLKALDDPDAEVRAAALAALGAVVDLKNLSVLTARVVAPRRAEDTAAATQALREAAVRMPDREACAEQLVAAMRQAPVPVKGVLLEILSTMGGSKALEAMGAAAKDTNPQLQDTASRLLGEWMTIDAAPVLLDVAKSVRDEKYEIRAMRGYIRLARQFLMSDDQRADMCRTALQVAKRDAEKKLVLEVLERYPSLDTLQLAVQAAETPALKNDAARVSLAIAQKIGGSAEVQKLLAQVGHEPVKVEITKAVYGAGENSVDVTQILRKHVRDLPLIVLPSSSYNSAFGGDPASGVVKQLKIEYKMDGKAGEATFAENATIMLPLPK